MIRVKMMTELYEGVRLSQEQMAATCRSLYDLAEIDGVAENEMELIQEFWRESGGEPGKLEALLKSPFELKRIAEQIKAGGEEIIGAFFLSCYLLVYADGLFAPEERARLKDYAEAILEGDMELLESYDIQAKLFLLKNFALGLRNRDAIRRAGEALALSDEQINSVMEG